MERIKEYDLEFRLASGADLRMLLFDNSEHRWIFSYKYVSPEERTRSEKPDLTNETKLVVDYEDGIAQKIGLTMNVFRPKKRGKDYFLGIDISEGSHAFVEFAYEKQDTLFRMRSISIGARRIDLDTLGEGLVKPIDFPFPVKNRLENERGTYHFPFLKNDGAIAFFEFPENYLREI